MNNQEIKPELDELLTRQEVAAILRISPVTLWRREAEGKQHIPYLKVGSRARYRRRDVEDFIQSGLQHGRSQKDAVSRSFADTGSGTRNHGSPDRQARTSARVRGPEAS